MPKKEPSRQFKVGDKVRVNLHHGKIGDAVVKATIESTDGIIQHHSTGKEAPMFLLITIRRSRL